MPKKPFADAMAIWEAKEKICDMLKALHLATVEKVKPDEPGRLRMEEKLQQKLSTVEWLADICVTDTAGGYQRVLDYLNQAAEKGTAWQKVDAILDSLDKLRAIWKEQGKSIEKIAIFLEIKSVLDPVHPLHKPQPPKDAD